MRNAFDLSETRLPFPIASAEKALFDCLYISSRKNKRFSSLPELDLDEDKFDKERFLEFLNLVKDKKIKNHIKSKLPLFLCDKLEL